MFIYGFRNALFWKQMPDILGAKHGSLLKKFKVKKMDRLITIQVEREIKPAVPFLIFVSNISGRRKPRTPTFKSKFELIQVIAPTNRQKDICKNTIFFFIEYFQGNQTPMPQCKKKSNLFQIQFPKDNEYPSIFLKFTQWQCYN